MVSVRLARKRDVYTVGSIAYKNKPDLGFIPWPWLFRSQASKELHVATVRIRKQNRIVGFIRWHRRKDGSSTVYEMCVSKNQRRRGVGKKLMAAIGNGPAQLKCRTNNPALHFYHHLGFEIVGGNVTKGGMNEHCLARK